MKMKLFFLTPILLLLFSCSKDSDAGPDPVGLNPWDGKYRMEGVMTDMVNPAFTWHNNNHTYAMETTSSTQIKVVSDDLTIPGIVIANGINATYYGTFGLLINFDPATNEITSVTNSYGQPSSSGRSAVLDPSGINEWDPVTKNLTVKFWMDENGSHRSSFEINCVYIGAR